MMYVGVADGRWEDVRSGRVCDSTNSYFNSGQGKSTGFCTKRKMAAAFTFLALFTNFAAWFATLAFVMEYDYRKSAWIGAVASGLLGCTAMALWVAWIVAFNKGRDSKDTQYGVGDSFALLTSMWIIDLLALIPMRMCGIFGNGTITMSRTLKTTLIKTQAPVPKPSPPKKVSSTTTTRQASYNGAGAQAI
jgi:hypothetical protein